MLPPGRPRRRSVVAGAATEVAGQALADVVLGRIGDAAQQVAARRRAGPACRSRTAPRPRAGTRPAAGAAAAVRRGHAGDGGRPARRRPARRGRGTRTRCRRRSRTVHEPHSPCSQAFLAAVSAEVVAQDAQQARPPASSGTSCVDAVDDQLKLARSSARRASTPAACRRYDRAAAAAAAHGLAGGCCAKRPVACRVPRRATRASAVGGADGVGAAPTTRRRPRAAPDAARPRRRRPHAPWRCARRPSRRRPGRRRRARRSAVSELVRGERAPAGALTNASAGIAGTGGPVELDGRARGAASAASASADGSASTSAPPSVPRLRIWREATVRAAAASPGSRLGQLLDDPRVGHACAQPQRLVLGHGARARRRARGR